MELQFTIDGNAKPQGSKTGFVRNGRVVMVEAVKGSREWRQEVVKAAKAAASAAGLQTIDRSIPVNVAVEFFFDKPKSVTRQLPSVKPDLDKLLRNILDGLTEAQIWEDDCQCVTVTAQKRYGAAQTTVSLWT
jgi:Holliday junction resolvase RusA-like endonuclease